MVFPSALAQEKEIRDGLPVPGSLLLSPRQAKSCRN